MFPSLHVFILFLSFVSSLAVVEFFYLFLSFIYLTSTYFLFLPEFFFSIDAFFLFVEYTPSSHSALVLLPASNWYIDFCEDGGTCAFGSQCIYDEISKVASCQCDSRSCDGEQVSQVCGSDNTTYTTACSLQLASCSEQRPLHVRHLGSCDGKYQTNNKPNVGCWKWTHQHSVVVKKTCLFSERKAIWENFVHKHQIYIIS